MANSMARSEEKYRRKRARENKIEGGKKKNVGRIK